MVARILSFTLLAWLAAAPLAAAESSAPLSAALKWENAVGVGTLAVDGTAWVVHTRMDLRQPTPDATLFLLDADKADIRWDYVDFVAVPDAAAYPTGPKNHGEETRENVQLRAHAAREQVLLMVVPREGAPPPRISLLTHGLSVAPMDGISEDFYSTVLEGEKFQSDLQQRYTREGPALSVATGDLGQSTTVEGDFVVYLWDLDVADANDASKVYASGTSYWNEQGSQVKPKGVFAQKRDQILTLAITGGRLTFAIPDRPLDVRGDVEGLGIRSTGSWDILGASGSVDLAGRSNAVDAADVHLAGDFSIHYQGASDVTSRWGGSASEAAAGGKALSMGNLAATTGVSRVSWWPFVVGLTILGVGSASVWGARTYKRRGGDQAGAPLAEPLEAEEDGLVAENITLLQSGQAAQVIANLEPDFDPDEAAAPVRAYLLSLAHLREGRNEAGVQWILRAVASFPDFAQELRVNDAFAPIRGDPRIQRLINQEGVTGYV